jgi:hypothetical protein
VSRRERRAADDLSVAIEEGEHARCRVPYCLRDNVSGRKILGGPTSAQRGLVHCLGYRASNWRSHFHEDIQ